MTKAELQQFSITELESISYELTAERQKIRDKALMVQTVLSEKIEAERINKILGKPVQSVTASGIESQETA